MDNSNRESTNKLLKVIIALLLRGRDAEPLNARQKIEALDQLGLKPSEIAEILGRTAGYVSKELVGIRKKAKR